jgi:putative molybdopterin biosynthesis protein
MNSGTLAAWSARIVSTVALDENLLRRPRRAERHHGGTFRVPALAARAPSWTKLHVMGPRREPDRPRLTPNNLLTTRELAALLQVHPKHVYRLMRRDLPALRVGDEWRFDRQSVLAWAAHARSAATVTDVEPGVPAIVAANGDLVVEALLAQCTRKTAAPVGFVLTDHAGGVSLLQRRLVLAAGCHAGVETSALQRGNARQGDKVVRLQLVAREFGLACAPGKRIKTLGGIVGKRLAIRPETSGLRRRLNDALASAGINARAAYRRAVEHACHKDVALAVARGDVDLGLTTHAWAHAAGLSFFAMDVEEYDFCFLADHVDDARVVVLCEEAQSATFRRYLRGCAGYDPSRAGRVRPGGTTLADVP